ncbi:DUF421 domain-containing protein [Spirosoma daeguense]
MQFDLKNLLIRDLDWLMAVEIVTRTLVMFTLILVFLRMTGKKGIRQLSIFEVAIIIGLGSAVGDPMVNEEHAILPAFLVIVTILLLYRLLTWLAARRERFERLLEGEPLYIIEEGKFVLQTQADHTYAKDEFFAEMRQQNIEHVGQVRLAILETSGNVSFYYYANEDVKSGLPILPKAYQKRRKEIQQAGKYACTTCGQIEEITARQHACPRCQQTEWVEAIQTIRRT